jgi:cellulose synthase/poly-beta-1,6-N-acetylglucosamine synthase-like glycosyltransferase
MLFINIGVAYRVTEVILSLYTDKTDLPKLERLNNYPAVAILHVTYNDVFPQILPTLKSQTYPNYEVFILDDSTNEGCKSVIDRAGFLTIRRDNRNGYKAGALNNWLSIYGENYKYFIISDSDSYFEPDFIETMVEYAEHKSNSEIAIFQSRIINWNNSNIFPRIASTFTQIFCFINERLANDCEYIISWGHNNLHRTEAIFKIHGFTEKFVAEDLASGLRLIERGYKCKLVDVTSYDMFPESIRTYSTRQMRWSKQNLDLINLNPAQLNPLTKLHFYMHIYDSIIWIAFFIGIFVSIFLYNPFFRDIFMPYSINDIWRGEEAIRLILSIFYVLAFVSLGLPIASRLNVSILDYYKSFILMLAVSYFIMPYIIKELIKTVFGYKTIFIVTNKLYEENQNKSIFIDFYFSTIFFVIVFLKVIYSPLIVIHNFLWLIPLLLSPAIIYIIERQYDLEATQTFRNDFDSEI